MNTLITVSETDSSFYFAPALELDYDEPNAVADEMELEFVVARQFVQTVELPAAEEIGVKKQVRVAAEQQRTAA